MAIGSNLVRPTRDKLIMTDSITMAIGSNLVRPTRDKLIMTDSIVKFYMTGQEKGDLLIQMTAK
jgi:hypothetical protein